tara:strand:- start:744 stop:938 length:195 start_codon:yes stop_codon:yes gene_type:complete
LNTQDLLLSKKLLSSYKERLEKEIIKRSNKLRIPTKILQKIINNNNEIIELKNAIEKLNKNSSS